MALTLPAAALIILCGSPAETIFGDVLGIQGFKRSDAAKCEEFGFRPGTESYANCRLQLEAAKRGNDMTCRRNGNVINCF
jgi:hypothetical protein